ncbi:NUDIX domain-containing protein [Haloarchaeobius sp. HME9146]|uniref:NUDIX domain-containing protein n=1 Tax=Haloarchaeobius sp. HME9146 TaxID=2978732 RepID=UPI0021C1F812|nr:NUDIX domain-containing protein [Haloarchaeobius sp. HME9146]MCT9095453.1 NUDIX domain-containing protein [Haloarchaeobius sp. HME9146]
MSDGTHVVTAFLRNEGTVLLLRRSDAVGTYTGQWGGVSGFAEDAPDEQALVEISEETGLDETAIELVGTGTPVRFTDEDLDRDWVVHPYLFDCETQDVTLSDEHDEYEWVSPTEIPRRDAVPELWTAYQRVAPTVRDITADDQHGAAYLSLRALEVLRDRAGLLVQEGADDDEAWDELTDLGQRLLRARPSMAVLKNRVNRALASADQSAASLEQHAIDGIHRAVTADTDAAVRAGALISDRTVLTLSRSGTVLGALRDGSPMELFVAESRPGGEGVAVAEALVDEYPVTLVTDAGVAHTMATEDVDAVLVGADTVLPDGTVVNKTGTRAAALAAAHEEIPLYVVCSTDKVSTEETVNLETGRRSAVYDGDAPLSVSNPVFDETPPHLVDTIVTERGDLDSRDVREVAEELASLETWDGEESDDDSDAVQRPTGRDS